MHKILRIHEDVLLDVLNDFGILCGIVICEADWVGTKFEDKIAG